MHIRQGFQPLFQPERPVLKHPRTACEHCSFSSPGIDAILHESNTEIKNYLSLRPLDFLRRIRETLPRRSCSNSADDGFWGAGEPSVTPIRAKGQSTKAPRKVNREISTAFMLSGTTLCFMSGHTLAITRGERDLRNGWTNTDLTIKFVSNMTL